MKLQQVHKIRQNLLNIFKTGLQSVNGRTCVTEFLQKRAVNSNRIRLIAIGKAAESMVQGALDVLDERIISGLLISKQGHISETYDTRFTVLESDHPVPSERSLAAGKTLLDYLESIQQDEFVLILISGGTSALVECLPEGVSLKQLQDINNWLLANPWPIHDMNALRQSVSLIKAGRALKYIKAKQVMQLTISDVASNDLSVIGSGLFHKPESLLKTVKPVPEWIRTIQLTVQQWEQQFDVRIVPIVEHMIVADNALARDRIQLAAKKLALDVMVNQELYSDIHEASQKIVQSLIEGKVGLYIWGGETVVSLPEHPGKGGRCQALALEVANGMKATNIPFVFLACGTDGTDGPGDVAGALVDNGTIQRGEMQGLNADIELKRANAGAFLESSGDLIDTGLTGTNVMDLMMAIKLEP